MDERDAAVEGKDAQITQRLAPSAYRVRRPQDANEGPQARV